MSKKTSSRRDFIKVAAATAPMAPAILARGRVREPGAGSRSGAPSDAIRFGTIGMGGMGFGDTRTALEVPGTEFVAAADCYDGRLLRVKEVYGPEVATTRDYREVLARSDVDAVIVATSDHWHAQIAIEALKAGKAVYLEKPMVHDLEEGPQVLKAERATGKVLQVGSQYVSSLLYEKARELYQAGAIGVLNLVEAVYNRNSATGAWQYSIPTDASPQTVDWQTFLGSAPKRRFDPLRFFRWRNYWDYGTGIPGDLFVHLFSGIHLVLGSNGPTRVFSTGGLRHWKDGRDVPDVVMGLLDYSASDSHPDFNMSLQVNFADGSGGGTLFRFIGDEGVMTIGSDEVKVTRLSPRSEPGHTVGTFTEDQQEAFMELYRRDYPEPKRPSLIPSTEKLYRTPEDYNSRLDHFTNFFNAMRGGDPVVEDATYGYRAAAPALICNLSYRENRAYHWDPKEMKLVS